MATDDYGRELDQDGYVINKFDWLKNLNHPNPSTRRYAFEKMREAEEWANSSSVETDGEGRIIDRDY